MEIPRKNSLPNSPSFFKALSCHRAPPMTFSGARARKRRPARLKGGVVVFFPEIIDEPINQGDLYWLWTDNQSSIRLINDPINKDGTVYQLDPYYNLHWLLISIIEMGWLINGMVDEWDGWLMWDAHWLSMRWQNNVGWFSGFREIVGTCPGNVGWSRHLVISELNWGLRHAQPVFAQSLQNAAVDDDGNWLSYSDGNHVYYMKKHVASPNIIPNIIPRNLVCPIGCVWKWGIPPSTITKNRGENDQFPFWNHPIWAKDGRQAPHLPDFFRGLVFATMSDANGLVAGIWCQCRVVTLW